MSIDSVLTLDVPVDVNASFVVVTPATKVKPIDLHVSVKSGDKVLQITYGWYDASDNLLKTQSFRASGDEVPVSLLDDLKVFVGKVTAALQTRGDLESGSVV